MLTLPAQVKNMSVFKWASGGLVHTFTHRSVWPACITPQEAPREVSVPVKYAKIFPLIVKASM